MDWLKPATEFAQLLNILLIPIVLFAYRVLKHMTVVESFMDEARKSIGRLSNKVEEHDRAISRGGLF